VLSVQHNGTRTLMHSLGIFASKQGLGGAGDWWHFGNPHQPLIDNRAHFGHIPIRNPLDVAKSWACRNKSGDIRRDIVARYREMFHYIEHRDCELYRIEDFPRLKGHGEHPGVNPVSSIRVLQDHVREHVIEPHRAFFEQYYDDL
jgi:hypothetical protein